MDPNQVQNTSEQGNATSIPDGVRGWNWGAFLMGVIWAIGNKVWSMVVLWVGLFIADYAFLIYTGDNMSGTVDTIFLVIFGVLSIVLGMKGNEWAWHDKKWDSVEHFKRTQSSWAKWGVIITVASLIIGLVLRLTGIVNLQ